MSAVRVERRRIQPNRNSRVLIAACGALMLGVVLLASSPSGADEQSCPSGVVHASGPADASTAIEPCSDEKHVDEHHDYVGAPFPQQETKTIVPNATAPTPSEPTTVTTSAPEEGAAATAPAGTARRRRAATIQAEEPPVLPFVPDATPAVRPKRSIRTATPSAPAPEQSERIPFVASITRPTEVSWSPAHVVGNASIAVALVLLLGLPAELFNSAIKARYGQRPPRRFPRIEQVEAAVHRLPDWSLLVSFGFASALVYAQLDPSIGFDRESAEFVGMLALALIIVTAVLEVVRIPYLKRRHGVGSHLRMFPKAFVVAVVLVVLSRITGFKPGFIFGATCGLAVGGRLRDEDEGKSIAIACAALLGVAVAAWVAWIPAASAAAQDHPSAIAILFDTFLATLWVTGLQVVLFGLLPIRFLYGEKVLQWSRLGWLALYGTAMFLFVQTLFHPQAGQWAGLSGGELGVIALIAAVLFAASFVFWLWTRLRPPARARLAAA